MKRKSLLIAFAAFSVAANPCMSQSEYVKQIIIAEGAGSKVYVSAYNPMTGITTVFDSIYTGYVQDVLVDGGYAYVAASDSIMKYNLDNYTRVDERKVENVNKLALYNDQLIAGRWISANNNIWLRVYDKNDLSVNLYDIPEIDDQTYGIAVANDTAYVAVNGGYGNPEGKIAVIDLVNHSFTRWIDIGTEGEGIGDLMSDGSNLYMVFETWVWNAPPDTKGGVGIYDIGSGNLFIDTIAQNFTRGYFVNGTAMFLQVNDNIGVYDLYNHNLVDIDRIPKPAGYGVFCSVVHDRINHLIYANETDYFSYGMGKIYDLAGDSAGTYNIGIAADAMDIDYRINSSVENNIAEGFNIYPNPGCGQMYIKAPAAIERVELCDMTGRIVFVGNSAGNSLVMDMSSLVKGMYILKVFTGEAVYSEKVICR